MRCLRDAGPGFPKPQPEASQPPQLEHSQEAKGCPPRAYTSRRPALFLPREKVSSPGTADWVGVARSSGNRPKAPPLPASRPTARPPGERRLFFQKLRGLESTVCAPQGQVGKWSRRRRGEKERVGRGAPRFSAKYQPWEVAPRFLTLCGFKMHEAGGRGYWGKLLLRLGHVATLLATHPSQCASHPPPGNSGQHREPGGTREGEGATSPRRDPPLRTVPLFRRSPTISTFPA